MSVPKDITFLKNARDSSGEVEETGGLGEAEARTRVGSA